MTALPATEILRSGSQAALPPVNQALEPSWVRKGSATVKQDYENALAFESVLVQQLAGSLGGEGEEGQGSEEEGSGPKIGSGLPSSMLQQALAKGVEGGGGLGLAAQLTHELMGTQGVREVSAATRAGSAAATTAAGGVSAPAATGPAITGGASA
jgi:hypothetical protein